MSDLALKNVELLVELAELLATLADAQYAATDARLPGSTIGKQVRHCLDHYHRLLVGLESGVVDYGLRTRDPELEVQPALALDALVSLRTQLSVLSQSAHARNPDLAVRLEDDSVVATTLARELDFLASHTTHHLALLGLLARQEGARVQAAVGVSFSTRRWLERLSQAQGSESG